MSDEFEQPGEFLQRLLDDRGISQVRLSQALDLDSSQLNRWLKGKKAVPSEYIQPLIDYLGTHRSDLEKLRDLHDVSQWKANVHIEMRKLLKKREPALILSNYLFALAMRFLEVDAITDPDEKRERIFVRHLQAMRVAIHSVGTAKSSDPPALFAAENLKAHLQYPVNYYVGALMRAGDITGPINEELAEQVTQFVKDAVATEGTRFQERSIRHHAAHILSRYGPKCIRTAQSSRTPHS